MTPPPHPADRPSRLLSLLTVAVLAITTLGPAAPAARQPIPAPIGPAPLVYQSPPGPAATASERMHALAVAAGQAPTVDPAGSTEHLRILSWALHTQVSHARTVSTGAYTERESWRAPNDSGRIHIHHPARLEPSDPSAIPGRIDSYPPGGFPARWPARYGRPPANAADLAGWLRAPNGSDPDEDPTGWHITAVTDLLRERVLTSGQRAAVLRLLAQQPGLGYAGHVTDRVGRRGHAFILTSSSGLPIPVQHTLIIDQAGLILAHEQTLTSHSGQLDVPIPAVIAADIYLTADHVQRQPTPGGIPRYRNWRHHAPPEAVVVTSSPT